VPTRKKGSGGTAFTVDLPTPLPAERRGDAWWMEVEGRELRLSNLDKVFWPEEGFTKGDLVAYYFNVAELILPHLYDRPLTMKRMPDGVAGDAFYEKTAPSHTPDWIARCPVPSEDSREGVIGYLADTSLEDEVIRAHRGSRVLVLPATRPRKSRIDWHLCSEDIVALLKALRPEVALLNHLGLKMVRAGPDEEALWIEAQSGVRTVAAKDGMRVSLGDKVLAVPSAGTALPERGAAVDLAE